MRIRYVGKAGKRLLGEYTFGLENGYTVDVRDARTAADMLTYPRKDFELGADDLLHRLPGFFPDRAAELALAGVSGIEALAVLGVEEVAYLAQMIMAPVEQVAEWSVLAQQLLEEAAQEERVAQEERAAVDHAAENSDAGAEPILMESEESNG